MEREIGYLEPSTERSAFASKYVYYEI